MSNKSKTIAQSTMIIIIFSLVGKLMGFGRESLIAAHFGASMEKDAFVAAQAATSTVSQFIVMGISTVFIPSLQSVLSARGEDGKLRFTNNIFFIVSIFTTLLAILGIIFSPYLAKLVGPRFNAETAQLTAELIRLGMPVIIFSAWQGIFTGYLQFEGHFGAAASAPIWLNGTYIIYLIFLADQFGIYGLTIVSVIGIIVQFLVVFLASFKADYRIKPVFDLKDHYTRQTLVLAIPAIITVSVNNINTLVNRALASGLPTGSMSRLDYANKLNLIIIGVFITAVTSVIFPQLAKAFDEGNIEKGKRIMNGSIRGVLLITIPSFIGMLVLARPIVELAFMRGAFTQADAIATARVLQFYTLALVSLSVNNVQNRVFYSLEDTKTPFYLGILNVAINVGLNLLLINVMGVNGLALSVSIATTTVALVSFQLIRRKIGNIGGKSYIKLFIKTGIAVAIMGIFCHFGFNGLSQLILSSMSPGATYTLVKLLILLFVVLIAAILYFLILYALGLREVHDIKKIIENKIKGRKAIKN